MRPYTFKIIKVTFGHKKKKNPAENEVEISTQGLQLCKQCLEGNW